MPQNCHLDGLDVCNSASPWLINFNVASQLQGVLCLLSVLSISLLSLCSLSALFIHSQMCALYFDNRRIAHSVDKDLAHSITCLSKVD